MSPWRATRIEPIGIAEYRVDLDGEEGPRTITCTVVEQDGIVAVQPKPDLFMVSPNGARDVVAAVIEVHRSRESGTRNSGNRSG
jgi:hypothetical protein